MVERERKSGREIKKDWRELYIERKNGKEEKSVRERRV